MLFLRGVAVTACVTKIPSSPKFPAALFGERHARLPKEDATYVCHRSPLSVCCGQSNAELYVVYRTTSTILESHISYNHDSSSFSRKYLLSVASALTSTPTVTPPLLPIGSLSLEYISQTFLWYMVCPMTNNHMLHRLQVYCTRSWLLFFGRPTG